MYTVDTGVLLWVTSEEGISFQRRASVGMLKEQNQEQIILTVSALLWYERLRLDDSNAIEDTISGSYLWDFGRLLAAQQLPNRRAVWERMALSLARVIREEDYSLAVRWFLDSVVRNQPALDLLDGLSDQYWKCMLTSQLGHMAAWEETRRIFERKGCFDHPGWVLGDDDSWVILGGTVDDQEQDADGRV